jgi:hypothetical protein
MVFLVYGWDLARLPQALFKSLQQELPIIMVVRCCWLKLSFVISYHLLCTIGYGVRKFLFNMHVVQHQVIEQDMLGGNRQWISFEANASGVMPIILRKQLCLFQLP